MKKILKTHITLTLAALILCATAAPCVSFAQTTVTSGTTQPPLPTTYTLLAPLPLGNGGTPVSTVNVGAGGIQTYVIDVLDLVYGMAAVLAIIVIIIGGIQYMSTDAISGKQDGKRRIQDALWGLLLVICSYVVLYTINPNLVSLGLLSNDIANAPAPVISGINQSLGMSAAQNTAPYTPGSSPNTTNVGAYSSISDCEGESSAYTAQGYTIASNCAQVQGTNYYTFAISGSYTTAAPVTTTQVYSWTTAYYIHERNANNTNDNIWVGPFATQASCNADYSSIASTVQAPYQIFPCAQNSP